MATRLVQVDGDFCAHTGNDVLATGVVKGDNHRDTLADFGEVAAGVVLGGQQRELGSGGLHNLLHMAAEAGAAIGIDGDVNRLTGADIADGILIHVGGHSQRIEIGDLDDGQTGGDHLPLHGEGLHDATADRAGDIDG